MSPESISELAKSAEKKEKTQAELRTSLQTKLNSLEPILNEGIKEYKLALKEGTFEDQEGEAEGSGEARKLALQKRLTAIIDRAEKMKNKLDSGEPLTQVSEEISATYTHPDGHQETITIDFETKLADFISFYTKNNIDTPPDFEDTIREIYNNNQTEIQESIEQKGFDEILLIPPTTDLADLAEKMKIENGVWESDNFKNGGSFAQVTENSSKTRIVLIHKSNAQNLEDRPELNETKGKTADSFVNAGESLTLSDYLIYQKKYFEETNTHLDEKGWTWLPGSKSGSRVVVAFWSLGGHRLNVYANAAGNSNSFLGCRLSRSFD